MVREAIVSLAVILALAVVIGGSGYMIGQWSEPRTIIVRVIQGSP